MLMLTKVRMAGLIGKGGGFARKRANARVLGKARSARVDRERDTHKRCQRGRSTRLLQLYWSNGTNEAPASTRWLRGDPDRAFHGKGDRALEV